MRRTANRAEAGWVLAVAGMAGLLAATGPIDSAGAADGPAGIAGRWELRTDKGMMTVVLSADGRFELSAVSDASRQVLKGTWRAAEGRLVLTDEAGKVTDYRVQVDGDRMTVSEGDLSEKITFVRKSDANPAKPGEAAPAKERKDPGPQANPLVGRWEAKDPKLAEAGIDVRHLLVFYPDGSFTYEARGGGVPGTKSPGGYRLEGEKVTVEGGATGTLRDGKLTLQGGVLLQPTTFALEAGSADDVMSEYRKLVEQKRKEDADWAARIPVGPREAGGRRRHPRRPGPRPHVRQARPDGLRQDAELLLVLHHRRIRLPPRRGPDGRFRSSVNWWFLPNGRLYTRWETYTGAELINRGPVSTFRAVGKPDLKEIWGRYRLVPVASSEPADAAIEVETDKGEKLVLQLRNGRRTLFYGERGYDQSDWFVKQLK